MKRLEKLIKSAIYFFCCLTAILPIPRLPWLTTFLRIGILIWLHINMYIVVAIFSKTDLLVIANIIGLILFLLSSLSYLVVILESMAKQRSFDELTLLRCQLHALVGRHLGSAEVATFPAYRIIFILFAVMLCDAVKLWFNYTTNANPISNYLLLIELGIQTRFLQIILTIISANQEAENVATLLKKLVAKNKRKSKYGSDIWMPYTPWEYEQLNLLRFLYGRLYKTYGCVDNCFSWSIFLIIMEKCFHFVCNLFWSFQLFSTNRSIYKITYHLSLMVKSGLLIPMLCAVTANAENYSRRIGSLISQLPKSLGNKAYNDLVTNFSIQALHQQFSITFKNLFVLNHTLIGSMISAIITYSVVLIQFLIADEEPVVTSVEK